MALDANHVATYSYCMGTPANNQQSVDQLALAALAAFEAGNKAACDQLLAATGSNEEVIRLIWAATNEDMITLPTLLAKASPSSAYHLARMVWHTKERVPDRGALLPQIEEDLRLAATMQPPLLLAKVRYLHRLLTTGQDASAILSDIQAFPFNARDAELLAVILHAGGQTAAAIGLLSRILQQITDTIDQQVIATALVYLLEADNKPDMAAQLRTMMPAATNSTLAAWQQPALSTGDKATVIVLTNISPKFVYNQDSAPPSDAMIRQTLESFYGQLQAPRAKDGGWPLVIYFDEPRDEALKPQADEYREKLKQVATDYNARLECRPAWGLRRNFVEAISNVETPYYFFLEHDWTFSSDAPPLPLVLQTLQAHPDLNAIRYNYNFNHLQRHDYALMPYKTSTGLPLLTGTYYCNNPALIRTAKMQRDWLPLLTNEKYDAHNGGAGGVEEAIYLQMMRLIHECGILPVAKAMGCAVIGTAGNAPRAIHNGI